MNVPTRNDGESDLAYLTRKEVCWGLWQADALERMDQQDQTIAALQSRLSELHGAVLASKAAAETVSKILGFAAHDPDDIFTRDLSGHINVMGHAHGDLDYRKGSMSCRHADLRSRRLRAPSPKAKDATQAKEQ